MSDRDPRPLGDFEERLRRARGLSPDRDGESEDPNHGEGRGTWIGMAFRIGVELTAALIVGVGLGLLLDYWLGTRPLFLIVFFLLGAGAGMMNVYRATMGYGMAVGYKDRSGGGTTPDGKE
jgi:ATP synthase protein I